MANPLVRPHLEFYPVDDGGYMTDAIHGRQWLYNMDAGFLSPMIRHNEQDYFVFEPTALTDQSICMPFRWFRKSDVFFAQAWKMEAVYNSEKPGWIVMKNLVVEIQASQLKCSFPYLVHTSYHCGLPDPRSILGR